MNLIENTENKPKIYQLKIRIEVISWKSRQGVKLRLTLISNDAIFFFYESKPLRLKTLIKHYFTI